MGLYDAMKDAVSLAQKADNIAVHFYISYSCVLRNCSIL